MVANLPDMVRHYGPARLECRSCRVALRLVNARVVDHAGSEWCASGLTRHVELEVLPPAPVIAPSPLLRGRR